MAKCFLALAPLAPPKQAHSVRTVARVWWHGAPWVGTCTRQATFRGGRQSSAVVAMPGGPRPTFEHEAGPPGRCFGAVPSLRTPFMPARAHLLLAPTERLLKNRMATFHSPQLSALFPSTKHTAFSAPSPPLFPAPPKLLLAKPRRCTLVGLARLPGSFGAGGGGTHAA